TPRATSSMSTWATSGARSTRRASRACSTRSEAPGTCSERPSESARGAALDPYPPDALVHGDPLGDPRGDQRALVLAAPLPPDPGSRHRLGGIGRHPRRRARVGAPGDPWAGVLRQVLPARGPRGPAPRAFDPSPGGDAPALGGRP